MHTVGDRGQIEANVMTEQAKKPAERSERAIEGEDEAGRRAARKRKLDEALETGLHGTFPGSDPVAITQPPRSSRDKGRR